MRTILRTGSLALLTLAILLTAAWGTLFVFYRMPGGEAARWASAGVVALVGLAGAAGSWRGWWPAIGLHTALFAAIVVWSGLLRPSNDRDWAVDVSRPLTATIGPEVVVVHDVRDFTWRTNDDVIPRWEERSYRLADLRSMDLINSYWMGPAIAHTLLAFGFADGRYLTMSIEIRRERDEDFSAIAGFFKQYELAFVAAEERDIVRVRSNVRGEDVQIDRITAGPDPVRRMFLELMGRANDVATRPSFYNSLDRNCTTEMFGAARAVYPGLPFGWEVILSGYLPDFAYRKGLLDTSMPFDELRRRSRASGRARTADADPDFSARIRDGLPDPNR